VTHENQTALLYFADPMCSWCWGFSPIAAAIAAKYADVAPIELTLGGLFPFTKEPLSNHRRDDIRHHWEHVHEASGQPFDHGFFEREGFVYDTEPSCRAVVAGRLLGAEPLALLAAIHGAFYRDGRDVTDADVLVDIAAEQGLDRDAFATMLPSDEAKKATFGDFQFSRSLGITGYPTLVARADRELSLIAMGYQPLESVVANIDRWLDGPV